MDEEEVENLYTAHIKSVLKTSTQLHHGLKLPILPALWYLQEVEKEGDGLASNEVPTST